MSRLLLACAYLPLLALGCEKQNGGAAGKPAPAVVRIGPGPKVQEELQTALIKATPGTTIVLAEGTYEFSAELSLTVPQVTIQGAGLDKTILDFKKQDQGKNSIAVTSDHFTIENLTIRDTKGDGLKVTGGNGVTCRKVRIHWSDGPKASNGAYGFYPVQCKNVLIEDCIAECASDAGIYVGQSSRIIVRRCKAERNVAGIEIENSFDADVYENEAVNNTGGILVFDLPDLQQKNGGRVRVFKNKVVGNNHANFAPAGNTVAMVPPGTGVMVMATDQVQVFDNDIARNDTASVSVISYLFTQKPIQDKEYDPYPEGIFIHGNRIEGGGAAPKGEIGMVLGPLLGKPLPDIIVDGACNPKKQVNGKLPAELGIRLKNNGAATYANLGYGGQNILQFALSKPKIERDAKSAEGELPALPAIQLQ